jgi:hypothetical protein
MNIKEQDSIFRKSLNSVTTVEIYTEGKMKTLYSYKIFRTVSGNIRFVLFHENKEIYRSKYYPCPKIAFTRLNEKIKEKCPQSLT